MNTHGEREKARAESKMKGGRGKKKSTLLSEIIKFSDEELDWRERIRDAVREREIWECRVKGEIIS